MKTLSLKLPDALEARLTDRASETGRTKSELVREALVDFFGKENGDGAGSCFDLARDLAGCVEGPRDLSSNPKHLRGYGR